MIRLARYKLIASGLLTVLLTAVAGIGTYTALGQPPTALTPGTIPVPLVSVPAVANGFGKAEPEEDNVPLRDGSRATTPRELLYPDKPGPKPIIGRLTVNSHAIKQDTQVFSVGLEIDNLTASEATLHFDPKDLKLELRDAKGKVVEETPTIRSGPAPMVHKAIIPTIGYVGISTYRGGIGLTPKTILLAAGRQAWVLKPGTYRVRGTVTVSVAFGGKVLDPEKPEAPEPKPGNLLQTLEMELVGCRFAITADAHEPNSGQKTEKIDFPYLLPGSRTVIGKELVDEVNALASKDEQIQFLLKILPPSDQKEKRLTERQLFAIRLLSLTDSDVVLNPLLDRFEFAHKSDGWPAIHALARLGNRSIEPVVKKLESVASDRQHVATLGAALIEIKKKQFPAFIDELKRRKDNKLSDKVLNELLDQYRYAPDK